MYEELHHYMPKIMASDVLTRLGLEKEKYFVVSAHREENINSEKNFKGLIDSLNLIAEKYGYPIIVSTHPRTRKKVDLTNPFKFTQSASFVLNLSKYPASMNSNIDNTVQADTQK